MFNNKNTAFVVTDPQVEFLKPKGAGYGLTKDILRKYHTTENLTELFKHACQGPSKNVGFGSLKM